MARLAFEFGNSRLGRIYFLNFISRKRYALLSAPSDSSYFRSALLCWFRFGCAERAHQFKHFRPFTAGHASNSADHLRRTASRPFGAILIVVCSGISALEGESFHRRALMCNGSNSTLIGDSLKWVPCWDSLRSLVVRLSRFLGT